MSKYDHQSHVDSSPALQPNDNQTATANKLPVVPQPGITPELERIARQRTEDRLAVAREPISPLYPKPSETE